MGTSGGGGLCAETVDGRNDVKLTGTLTSVALKERYEKARPIALSRLAVKRESDGAMMKEFEFQPATTSWKDRVLKADLKLGGEVVRIQLRLCAFECYPFGGDYTSYLHVAMVKLQGDETTVFETTPLR